MRQLDHPGRVLKGGPRIVARSGRSAGSTTYASGPAADPGGRWEADLRKLIEDRRTPLHLVGVGNPLRGDDSVGIRIVSLLLMKMGRRKVRNVIVHHPTTIPERALSKVDCANERVLIFDAVESGRRPGHVIFANLGDAKFGYFATHNVPLRIIPSVAANLSNVYVSGIEPEALDVAVGLSDTVRASADLVVSVVESALGGGPDGHS